MLKQLGEIGVIEINVDPRTGDIDGLSLEIKFGFPNSEAIILMRHPRPMPNTVETIRDDIVRLSEALLKAATRLQE